MKDKVQKFIVQGAGFENILGAPHTVFLRILINNFRQK